VVKVVIRQQRSAFVNAAAISFEQIKLVKYGIIAVISVYSFVFVIKFESRNRVESSRFDLLCAENLLFPTPIDEDKQQVMPHAFV